MSAGGDLAGRVAVVTGALGNLGGVWMRALVEAGATVVGLDLPSAKLSDEVATLADEHGARVHVLRADVTDRASLVEARDWCDARGVEPSVLVNNAGIDDPPVSGRDTRPVDAIPLDRVAAVLAVNALGTFQCLQVFGAPMTARGRGSIINIGSLYAGVAPDPRLYDHLAAPGAPPFLKAPAYGASKAAVVNLTRYFAVLWARQGVRVNALSPGGVRAGQDAPFVDKYTSRVPMGRMAERDDLVGPLLFLASDASRYVTGIELVVDGGFTAW